MDLKSLKMSTEGMQIGTGLSSKKPLNVWALQGSHTGYTLCSDEDLVSLTLGLEFLIAEIIFLAVCQLVYEFQVRLVPAFQEWKVNCPHFQNENDHMNFLGKYIIWWTLWTIAQTTK